MTYKYTLYMLHMSLEIIYIYLFIYLHIWGHSGTVVTHSHPPSEVYGAYLRPYVGKLIVAY